MRPAGAPADGRPAKKTKSGLCSRCYSRERRTPVTPISEINTVCDFCNRKMRKKAVKAADAPDTVPVGSFSDKICWTCLQKQRREAAASAGDFLEDIPAIEKWQYLAVKRLVSNDPELMQMLGLDAFEQSL